MQPVRILKFVLVSGLGTLATLFLTVTMLQFVSAPADATPAMAGGKPCTTCHSSSKPSKKDVKKKKSDWPDSGDNDVIALHTLTLSVGEHRLLD